MAAPVSTNNTSLDEIFKFINENAEPVVLQLQKWRSQINARYQTTEPVILMGATTIVCLFVVWLYYFIFQEEPLVTRTKKWFFRTLKRMPVIGAIIQREMDKTLVGVRRSMEEPMKNTQFIRQLPKTGKNSAEILEIAQSYTDLVTLDPQSGSISGAVYGKTEADMDLLIQKIYGMHNYSNPLHPDIFTDVRKMEAEVVRMCLTMFHGDSDACGVVSSGGTESILLACKAYRNRAYDMGIKHPEMIIPSSAHAAFVKASQCFKIKVVEVPVCDFTWAVKPRDIRRRINSNTIMIACSAPGFPHGILDPVEEVAKLGEKYGIPVHVDCCLGGFLLPFMEKAGFEMPPFDFRLPGVTSISCDSHKYGYAPKGSSVILYRTEKYRDYQFDVVADWMGGIYATSTFAGSRCGANATVCWAAMMYMGEQGYIDRTALIINTARYLRQGLEKIPNIFIFGDPKISVIAVGSLDFNIFNVYDKMTTRGWHLNAVQFPSGFHICVTLPMTKPGVIDALLRDMRASVEEVIQDPKGKSGGMGALYGMAQTIPDRSMVVEICRAYLSAYYSTTSSAVTNGGEPNGHHK